MLLGRRDGWHFRLIRCRFCYAAVALSFSLLRRGSKGQGENERAQNLFGTHCFRSENPIEWFSSDLEKWCRVKSVFYLFYQPMDEKVKTWTLRFPAKENPNTEKALFDWPIVLQYDVKAKYRLISRKFSCMLCPLNRHISVCFCFCFVRAFSFQGYTKITLTPHWSSAEER